ncbi:hypothetical protein ACQB60_18880 [Actinomycetota bacterium Odt1-20B]
MARLQTRSSRLEGFGSGSDLADRLGPERSCAVVDTELDVIADWLAVTTFLVPRGGEDAHIPWGDFLGANP